MCVYVCAHMFERTEKCVFCSSLKMIKVFKEDLKFSHALLYALCNIIFQLFSEGLQCSSMLLELWWEQMETRREVACMFSETSTYQRADKVHLGYASINSKNVQVGF